MAGTIATAYVQVMPSTEGITHNLEEQLGGAGEVAGKKAGSNFVGKMGKVLASAAAVKVVADFFKGAIKQGAELQQNIGGTQAVFGKAATDISSRATQAYKNMGLSASDYMATANKMGALFQGSGLSQVQSMQLTTKAMQRAADVASVMGIDTAAAMDAVAGAAKGNFTMMDNLGVAMNATTLQAYALEKGINFDWNTASQAEKSQLAMEMFFDRTSQYAGNFAKEAEATISGSLGMLKASWADFLGNLVTGGDVRGTFRNVFKSVVNVAKNILPAIGNIFLGLWDVAKEAAKGIGKSLGNAFQNLKSTIKTNAPGLYNLMDQTWDMIKTGATAAWDGLKSVAGDAWSGLKTLWDEHGGTLKQGMSDIWTGIQTRWHGALTGLSTFWSNWGGTITAGATAIWNNIKTGFEFGFTMISDAFSVFSSAFAGDWKGAWDGIKKLGTDAWDGISNAVSTAWSGLKSVASSAWEGIKGAVSEKWEALKQIDWGSVAGLVSGAWETIKGGIGEAWEDIKGKVADKWEEVKNAPVWSSIGEKASDAWSSIKGTISSAWTNIKSDVVLAWEKVKGAPAWTTISEKATSAWSAITGTISGAWAGIQSDVTSWWETVKNSPAWASISENATAAWGSITSTISSGWDTIKSSLIEAWEAAKGGPDWDLAAKADAAWNSFIGAVTGWVEAVKQSIIDTWNRIVGGISFNLPELPTLSITGVINWITGGGSGGSPNGGGGGIGGSSIIPHAKANYQPYMFSNPSFFMAGEAGDEFLYGRNALMADIGSVVAANASAKPTVVDSEILNTLRDLRDAMSHMGVYLDRDTLVGGIIGNVDNGLGERDALMLRGLA